MGTAHAGRITLMVQDLKLADNVMNAWLGGWIVPLGMRLGAIRLRTMVHQHHHSAFLSEFFLSSPLDALKGLRGEMSVHPLFSDTPAIQQIISPRSFLNAVIGGRIGCTFEID